MNITTLRRVITIALALCAFTPISSAQRKVAPIEVENPRRVEWPDETKDAFGSIPVQDRGRVKPMSTFAAFRLLAFNGKRKFELVEGTKLPTAGEKLDPVAWMLDVMLFPEQARHYEVFVVTDDEVLERIGVKVEGRKKRDRYSYAQLAEGRAAMEDEANRLRGIEPELRNRIDKQLLTLRMNVIEYEVLQRTFATLSTTLGDEPSARLLELYPEGRDGAEVPLGTVLSRWDTVAGWMNAARESGESEAIMQELAGLALGVDEALARADFALALVPPADGEIETWRSPGMVGMDLIQAAMPETLPVGEGELELIDAFAAIWAARGSVESVGPAIIAAQAVAQERAEERGQFASISLERTYYGGKFFIRALVCFLFAFVLMAISWMATRARWLIGGVWTFSALGLALVVAGVTIRCILLSRPPVATLYETILFITATAVLVSLVAEWLTKTRLALAIGTVLGAAGMFLAGKYEVVEAAQSGDTMGGLLAVLNTNFWLATHVTTVTLGYSAGLLAAALGHVWIALRVGAAFKARGPELSRESAAKFKAFSRIVYGVICFGLLFSVVGTILGGVWANDSWGRFWGWDPKENGALMIVLFELAIIHARLGGYIRDFGVAALAVANGAVVAFSWWHVNQLGVGLHSYGFTDGVLSTLFTYYGTVGAFLSLSVLAWYFLLRPKPPLGTA